MKKIKTILFLLAMHLSVWQVSLAGELAQTPTMWKRSQIVSYASSLKGLKKDALKTEVYNLMTPKTVLSYGSGEGSTWSGFYKTDRLADNSCVDRYSNETHYFSSTTGAISGMNIEHSFPKSWWGGSENNAYRDLFNLMPSESASNSSKSNYGMGVVTNDKSGNDCIKIGTGYGSSSSSTINLWEPADKWKGDFARGYMYMATAHQNLCSNYTSEGLNTLEKNTWPTLQKWAYTLYLKWSRQDKVCQLEVERNNAVYAIQKNRNLFVDYPNLAEYIWGDSINVAFDPATSMTTGTDDKRYDSYDPSEGGGGDTPTPTESIENTEETAYTVAEAHTIIDSGKDLTPTVYVKGYISQIQGFNSQYGEISYWLSDDGTATSPQFECYGGVNKGGELFTSVNDLTVGWFVVVKGNLKKYNNTTYEFNYKNEIVSIKASTGINSISMDVQDGHVGVYSVSGQKLTNIGRPGLYIVNGKKVIR